MVLPAVLAPALLLVYMAAYGLLLPAEPHQPWSVATALVYLGIGFEISLVVMVAVVLPLSLALRRLGAFHQWIVLSLGTLIGGGVGGIFFEGYLQSIIASAAIGVICAAFFWKLLAPVRGGPPRGRV